MTLSGRAKKIALGVGAVALLAVSGFFAYMELVKAGLIKYNKYDKRARGQLEVGTHVPDMTLALYQGGTVALSSLWKRPVLLIFGSCT